jgi:hypothetical protein
MTATDSSSRSSPGRPRSRRRRPSPVPQTIPQWAARYARSLIEPVRYRRRIREIERFCFFIGYARSGHTLLASLLDAHPEVVVSNELDAFRYIDHGFGKKQMYGLILWHEHVFGFDKRDFDYSVPGARQGTTSRLRVIGDKRGTATGFRLAGDLSLLDRARHMVKVPIRVIQHGRNPFDIIATSARLEAPDEVPRLAEAILWFDMWSKNLATIRPHLGSDELLETSHEKLVSEPREALERACQFIGVDTDETYLDQCASSVWPSPRLSRHSVTWTDEQVEMVDAIISRHSWLAGYTFDTE